MKTTLTEFIKDLKENIFSTEESSDLDFVSMVFACMEETEIMEHVIQSVLPNAEQIRARDLQFFIEQKKSIFQGLPMDRVNHIEQLITTPADLGGMSDENKDVVWSYFEAMVDIASEYKKRV